MNRKDDKTFFRRVVAKKACRRQLGAESAWGKIVPLLTFGAKSCPVGIAQCQQWF